MSSYKIYIPNDGWNRLMLDHATGLGYQWDPVHYAYWSSGPAVPFLYFSSEKTITCGYRYDEFYKCSSVKFTP